jgi:hypothetical protein
MAFAIGANALQEPGQKRGKERELLKTRRGARGSQIRQDGNSFRPGLKKRRA